MNISNSYYFTSYKMTTSVSGPQKNKKKYFWDYTGTVPLFTFLVASTTVLLFFHNFGKFIPKQIVFATLCTLKIVETSSGDK